ALVTPDGTVLNYAGRTGEQPVSQAIRDALAATPSDPSSSFHAHSLQDSIVLAPIRIQGEVAALVAAGADAHFTERQLRELVMDVIVILVVAMFLSFEFSLAILNNLVTRPLSELTALFRRAAAGNLG